MKSPPLHLLRALAWLTASLMAADLAAADSLLLPFQGRLTDAAGIATPDGARVLQFKIYDAPVGGQAVWNGEVQKLTVNGGLVSTVLGSKADLSDVDFNKSLYLELTIDANNDTQITAADPPLLPRQSILPAVFASEAADSRKLAGQDWTPLFGVNNPSGTLLPAKIANGSLPGEKLTSATVTAAQLASETITAAQIAPRTITGGQIANNAISAAQIADGTIENRHVGVLSKLSASDGTPGSAVAVDAEGNVTLGSNRQAKIDVAGTLQIAAMAQQSLTRNGHIILGELIVQWGQDTEFRDIAHPDSSKLAFPIAFPNEVLAIVPGIYIDPAFGFGTWIAVSGLTKTEVTFAWNKSHNGRVRARASYIAIGR